MDEGSIAERGLVVTCREAPGILEFVEAALDDVAQRIDGRIDRDLQKPVAFGGDHGEAAALLHVLADEVGIIALVGKQDFCRRSLLFHERAVSLVIRDFPACQGEGDREAQSIDAEMDLGRKATF